MANYQWDPSNGWEHRPTPLLTSAEPPTDGERMVYETGATRFFNLAARGSFMTWRLNLLAPGAVIVPGDFNCFAWSVGHTDRWIEGGTVEQMEELYEYYHFAQCAPNDAEVELYRIPDAPEEIPERVLANRRVIPARPNPMALVLHAHRRSEPALDQTGLGCSSKLADGPLIAHNRRALEDTRQYGSRNPQITYGSIYQHWRRTPEHPSFPGKEASLRVPTKNHPQNQIFQWGTGSQPPGHPGDHLGLPGPPAGVSSSSTGQTTRGFGSYSAYYSQASSSRAMRSSSKSYARGYAQVDQTGPFDPIPAPSRAAEKSAATAYKSLSRAYPKLVKDFETIFRSWQKSWFAPPYSAAQNAADRCNAREFDALLQMGPTIIPLVIYKMLDRQNFTATFLYNALERERKYRVDPRDVLNYLVLQRQNNLIVEINQGRTWG